MAPNDPYTAKAEQDASVEQKKSELESIIKESKFSMLTSRDSNGDLHSRAMSPASHQGLVFTFVANRDSGKFDELANDSNVNVSFSDPSSTDWASVAGNAKINTDVEAIKKVWSPLLKSWFGKIDSTKTGEPGDPRIALIEVIPTEVSYYYKTLDESTVY
jgi:general stress protein 26